MKCQKCQKPATFHITEIVNKKAVEYHFCEEHAKEYLKQTEPDPVVSPFAGLGPVLQEHLQSGALEKAGKELAELDSKTCQVCGITFSEFRNQGRLGCPHDYVEFAEELEQLLWNIHGAAKHTGKHPKTSPGDTDARTELIRLRREMKEAVELEDYERAGEIRDQIHSIEEKWKKPHAT